MAAQRFAPKGAIWVCAACGKTARDKYGMEGEHSPGWDESCMLNAFLCRENALFRNGDRVVKADVWQPTTTQDGGGDE